jgi:cell division septation protein DedD
VEEKGGSAVAVKGGTTTSTPPTNTTTGSTTPSAYMIQLAAYRDARNFDDTKVRNIGSVIDWPKGQFTAKVLTGFSTLDQARTALPRAKAAGFPDAYIVTQENGQLKKVN